TPDDVDAYRFMALDAAVVLHAEITTEPAPYRLILADWRGAAISASDPTAALAVVGTQLPPPGADYLFGDAPVGAVDPSVSYRLTFSLTYPSAEIPNAVTIEGFRDGAEGAYVGESFGATYSQESGSYVVALRQPGRPDAPSWSTGRVAPPIRD